MRALKFTIVALVFMIELSSCIVTAHGPRRNHYRPYHPRSNNYWGR